MRYVLTLVAGRDKAPLEHGTLSWAARLVRAAAEFHALSPQRAYDLFLSAPPSASQLQELETVLGGERVDFFLMPAPARRKKLLLADMDSTIVAQETLDELARFAGVDDAVRLITERAMNGDLNFEQALIERLALLKGLDESALAATLKDMTLNPGARTFVRTMRAYGARCVLISGGFTYFTESISQRAGFDHHIGNIFEMDGGRLTGGRSGPLIDKHAKLATLEQECAALGLDPFESLAIGDGANDLPMLEAAGLGLGYYPRPAVAQALGQNIIRHGDLETALFVQGYTEADFIRD